MCMAHCLSELPPTASTAPTPQGLKAQSVLSASAADRQSAAVLQPGLCELFEAQPLQGKVPCSALCMFFEVCRLPRQKLIQAQQPPIPSKQRCSPGSPCALERGAQALQVGPKTSAADAWPSAELTRCACKGFKRRLVCSQHGVQRMPCLQAGSPLQVPAAGRRQRQQVVPKHAGKAPAARLVLAGMLTDECSSCRRLWRVHSAPCLHLAAQKLANSANSCIQQHRLQGT